MKTWGGWEKICSVICKNKEILVPMRQRGNAVQTRQRHRFKFYGFNHLYFALHFNGETIFHQYDKKQWVRNYHAWRWRVWTAFPRWRMGTRISLFLFEIISNNFSSFSNNISFRFFFLKFNKLMALCCCITLLLINAPSICCKFKQNLKTI